MTNMEINIKMTNEQKKRCSLQKPEAIGTFAWFQHSCHDVKSVA